MGPAEVWRMVDAGGGVAEMTVRELRDAFGVPRLTARARASIAAELDALGLHLEPPLEGLGLAARVRVLDAFERDPRPEPVAEAQAQAAASHAPAAGPPPPVPVPPPARRPARRRGRRRGRPLGRAAVLAVVAVTLLMVGVASAIVRSGGERPPTPAPAAAADGVRATIGAAGPPVAGAVLLEGYRMGTRLGRQGRFLEARRVMLALGAFRSAPAAARSYSVRAAQAMLAEALLIRTTRPARARALVRDAARLAPRLSSLPRARALVGRRA